MRGRGALERRQVREILPYASATGTKRNLDALLEAGWRLLISAAAIRNAYVLDRWPFAFGLDNGAWSAHQQQRPFDEPAFAIALERFGARADWVVCPDIVAGGAASLALTKRWLRQCLDGCQRALVAVQDGMEPGDVEPLLEDRVGLFVGGSTPWKLRTIDAWCALGASHGAWVHVGRVNSMKRIKLCSTGGATSFDGTSVTRYAVTLPKLERARRQGSLGLFSKDTP